MRPDAERRPGAGARRRPRPGGAEAGPRRPGGRGRHLVEAASAGQARALLGEPVVGVVLALDGRDGRGLQADLSRHRPAATVVAPGGPGAPARDDIAGLVCALGPLVGAGPPPADVWGVAADWLQLCHWDPALPPDNRPPIARPDRRQPGQLKEINDTRGHGAGDDALRAMARALGTALRREDTAYRVGGDEFAVLLPDATGLSAG